MDTKQAVLQMKKEYHLSLEMYSGAILDLNKNKKQTKLGISTRTQTPALENKWYHNMKQMSLHSNAIRLGTNVIFPKATGRW